MARSSRVREPVRAFKDVVAWRKAFELCLEVHRTTERFPTEEKCGLCFEMRKTARSVVCRIAEGHQHAATREYVGLLDSALSSIAQLETQILLGHRLGLFGVDPGRGLLALTDDVGRLLQALRSQTRRRLIR